MPALFLNIKIESADIFYLFKVTLSDVVDYFDEGHIKIRGKYKNECINFIKSFGKDFSYYQHLTEKDWISASFEMLHHVKNRSIFLYIEDHRIISEKENLVHVMNEFDKLKLDQMQYSFYKSQGIDKYNLLPFEPKFGDYIAYFNLNKNNHNIFNLVNSRYSLFSMASIVSVRYFFDILEKDNKRFKLHNKYLSYIFSKIWRYPKYLSVIESINSILKKISIKIFYYTPLAGYCTEKLWFEITPNNYNIGILKSELFANYDDDNGSYGESLVKRGLYPTSYDHQNYLKSKINAFKVNAIRDVALTPGEMHSLSYYPNIGRISFPPFIEIMVTKGNVNVNYMGKIIKMSENDSGIYFSNMHLVVTAKNESKLKIVIYDNNIHV